MAGSPLPTDDALVDLCGPLTLDQFALDQLSGRDIHGETAHRRTARQVEDERPLLLLEIGVVERLVDLHQGDGRLQHDVDVIVRHVEADGRMGLGVLDHELAQALPRLGGRGPRLDAFPRLGRQRRERHRQRLGIANGRASGRDTQRRAIAGGNPGRALNDADRDRSARFAGHFHSRLPLDHNLGVVEFHRPGRVFRGLEEDAARLERGASLGEGQVQARFGARCSDPAASCTRLAAPAAARSEHSPDKASPSASTRRIRVGGGPGGQQSRCGRYAGRRRRLRARRRCGAGAIPRADSYRPTTSGNSPTESLQETVHASFSLFRRDENVCLPDSPVNPAADVL